MQKVVVHFLDGSVRKGSVTTFPPHGPTFELHGAGWPKTREISLADLKAVFFVKDHRGEPDFSESKDFPVRRGPGLSGRVRVICEDGEVLAGYCKVYEANQPGLFLYPPDRRSNNERVYILARAIKKLEFV
jgi:hypothetical protein